MGFASQSFNQSREKHNGMGFASLVTAVLKIIGTSVHQLTLNGQKMPGQDSERPQKRKRGVAYSHTDWIQAETRHTSIYVCLLIEISAGLIDRILLLANVHPD